MKRRPCWCPNQSCGSWTLFLCKRFLLFQKICIDAGHVSENTLYLYMENMVIFYHARTTNFEEKIEGLWIGYAKVDKHAL